MNSLPQTQQRAVRLVAQENKQIYGKEILRKYEISSGAALASAIKALKDKGILDEESKVGSAIFDDPLFPIWLRLTFDN